MSLTIKDKALLDGLRQGNRRSIDDFYNSYFGLCAKIVLDNGGCVDDARDVFQDALLSLLSRLNEGSLTISSLPSYLKSTFRNIWLRKKKGGSYTDSIDFNDPDNKPILDQGEAPVDHFESESKFEKLNSCFEKCSPECQKLLDLYYNKKKSQREIAEIMGYTEGFVKTKKKRCMKNLKECMESKFE